jgi:hypothetical protein
MSVKEEKQDFLYNIKLVLEDIKNMMPESMKDGNGIIGSIFAMLMQFVELFNKISARFFKSPIEFSSEELNDAGAREFLGEIKKLNLSESDKKVLLDTWRENTKDKSAAWIALADYCLHMGNVGMQTAKNIIDMQLAVIKSKVTHEDSIENICSPDLAKEFEREIFLIKEAELIQIEKNNRIEQALLSDERDRDIAGYNEHVGLLQQGKERLKEILEAGHVVITRHYDLYKENAFGVPVALFQENRPEHHILHEEFEKLNHKLGIRP